MGQKGSRWMVKVKEVSKERRPRKENSIYRKLGKKGRKKEKEVSKERKPRKENFTVTGKMGKKDIGEGL